MIRFALDKMSGQPTFLPGLHRAGVADTVVFACTLQRKSVEGKIRDGLTSICIQGTPVHAVYFLCTEPVKGSARHDLQSWASEKFSAILEILDGLAIAPTALRSRHVLDCPDVPSPVRRPSPGSSARAAVSTRLVCAAPAPRGRFDRSPRPGPRPRRFRGPSADTRGCALDSAAHAKPEHAASAARPWPSVDTATPRSTATQGDTPRDREETARIAENSQLAGRFRRWWQVLGSNQRRLSRRFYRPLPLATRATCHAPPHSGGSREKNSGHREQLRRGLSANRP